MPGLSGAEMVSGEKRATGEANPSDSEQGKEKSPVIPASWDLTKEQRAFIESFSQDEKPDNNE